MQHGVADNPPEPPERDDALVDAARRQVYGDGVNAGMSLGSERLQAVVSSASALLASDSLPGYQILREIHRGGQGVVYQAIQESTKRKVAVKVVREGPFAGPPDRARFEREVRVLGRLNHPNIVAIHDSGEAAGRFYYVMDYIPGQPLDAYMLSARLSINDTLELFVKICDAVNAAHLRGVIHRDLKPGNIRIDSQGEPHVLDFGLAKLTPVDQEDGSQPQAMTVTGQFLGSLPWASPEQAEAEPSKIDTRTDVYSLGVILYQMLTGRFPYEVVGNMRDVLDRIMSAEPTKPSTIRRQINDEVETIVLKCLSKERERRYQTAGELGRDIRHYLAGEPIEAKRDSAAYVLRKQLARYRIPIAVGAVVVVLLVIAVVVSSSLYARANWHKGVAERERDRAVQAEHSKSQALVAEAEARAAAERSALEARAERDRAQEAEREARWQAYVASLGAAAAAIEEHNVADARRHLDAAPEEHRNWEWHYLDASSDVSLATIRIGDEYPTCADFSPDGARLAVGIRDGTVRIIATDSWTPVRTLSGHATPILAVRFHASGDYLYTCAYDDPVARIWDIGSDAESCGYLEHDGPISDLQCNSTGEIVAACSEKGTVRLWHWPQRNVVADLRDPDGKPLRLLAFSPDDRYLATASRGHSTDPHPRIRVWNMTGLTSFVLSPPSSAFRSLEAIVFSPDSSRVAAGCDYVGTVWIWDVETREVLIDCEGHRAPVTALTFSADGRRIATCSAERTIRLFDSSTGAQSAVLCGHQGFVSSVCHHPDAPLLASTSRDGTVRVWDSAGHARLFRSDELASFSSDGTRSLAWRRERPDGMVFVLDLLTGERLAQWKAHADMVWSAKWSPDGHYIATAGNEDLTVRIWDAFTGALVHVLEGHTANVQAIEFSPDGRRLASSAYDNTVRVWDVTTGAGLFELSDLPGIVLGPAFSPDNRWLAVTSSWTARMYDASNGRLLREIQVPDYYISAAFSPDGELLAAGGLYRDPVIRIWNAANLDLVRALKGHDFWAESIHFHPDGTRLVSSSRDGTLRLWDPRTGQQVVAFRNQAGDVSNSGFSSDGSRLISWSSIDPPILRDAVPYRVRFRERQAALAARERAQPIVADLHARLDDWSKVASAIRADDSLEDLVRQQALNLVLKYACAERAAEAQNPAVHTENLNRGAEQREHEHRGVVRQPGDALRPTGAF